MVVLKTLAAFLMFTFLLAPSAHAEILFEGYSKILLGSKPVGYNVSRYEFDAKKQQFISIYYTKTNADGGNITESLKAIADAKLKPISYAYTTLAGGKVTTIDATFKAGQMTALVKEGGKPKTVRQTMPKDAILSTFLSYEILATPNGLVANTEYPYNAIAEEDASLNKGTAVTHKKTIRNGLEVFEIHNAFKGEDFDSYVTAKGDVIATESPKQKLSTELVATKEQAIAGMSFSASSIELLFGSLPEGRVNALSKTSGTTSPTATAPTAPVAAPAPTPKAASH